MEEYARCNLNRMGVYLIMDTAAKRPEIHKNRYVTRYGNDEPPESCYLEVGTNMSDTTANQCLLAGSNGSCKVLRSSNHYISLL